MDRTRNETLEQQRKFENYHSKGEDTVGRGYLKPGCADGVYTTRPTSTKYL